MVVLVVVVVGDGEREGGGDNEEEAVNGWYRMAAALEAFAEGCGLTPIPLLPCLARRCCSRGCTVGTLTRVGASEVLG